jgi:hypothetical protein
LLADGTPFYTFVLVAAATITILFEGLVMAAPKEQQHVPH